MAAPPRIAWSRREPFGAWVRLDDATLIAVDQVLADRLGVPRAAATAHIRPLELHIAVTSRCSAPCDGCYMDARPDGVEPPFEVIRSRLAAAADAGVSTVALGGGEPLLRADLGQIAEAARALGLVPVMTTSGLGLTAARAQELRAFAQINVSHDGAEGAYRDVRGFDGQSMAERAIGILSSAGIAVGVNIALTAATFDRVAATADRVAALGAREIQLLRYKPGGRAADPSYLDRRLKPAQIERLWPMIQGLIEARRLRVRIDCAMVPLLSKALLARAKDVARTLAALGVFGCEAGRHLGGLRVDGSPAPCSFFSVEPGHAPSPPAIARRSLPLAGVDAPPDRANEIDRFRDYHAALPEPCASCALASVCRGGCQVVSRYAATTEFNGEARDNVFAPDPECPRVREFTGAL